MKGAEFLLRVMKKTLKLIVVMISQPCKYLKNIEFYTLAR